MWRSRFALASASVVSICMALCICNADSLSSHRICHICLGVVLMYRHIADNSRWRWQYLVWVHYDERWSCAASWHLYLRCCLRGGCYRCSVSGFRRGLWSRIDWLFGESDPSILLACEHQHRVLPVLRMPRLIWTGCFHSPSRGISMHGYVLGFDE